MPSLLDRWMPPDYAAHGPAIDHLLGGMLAIVIVVGVGVQLALVWVLVRFRRRDGRAARYLHGHSRAEVVWTVLPVMVLLGMAVASQRAWDRFRYSASADDPGRSKVLVIGQQFIWNVIYPGRDGTFGRYGLYPSVTDATWPLGPGGKAIHLAGVAGPASLPADRALAAVQRYDSEVNPLGKDFTDPAGVDDDYRGATGRTLYLPVNRPIEIDVQSKDVVHDFYLPNFRAQLYAIPGRTGKLVITPTVTSAELVARGEPGELDLACAQLCGLGHSLMRGRVVVLSQAEFDRRFPAAPHAQAEEKTATHGANSHE